MIKYMKVHNVAHLHFYTFMADFAQAKWNEVRLVIGSRNAKQPIEGMERTCDYNGSSLGNNTENTLLDVFLMSSILLSMSGSI